MKAGVAVLPTGAPAIPYTPERDTGCSGPSGVEKQCAVTDPILEDGHSIADISLIDDRDKRLRGIFKDRLGHQNMTAR